MVGTSLQPYSKRYTGTHRGRGALRAAATRYRVDIETRGEGHIRAVYNVSYKLTVSRYRKPVQAVRRTGERGYSPGYHPCSARGFTKAEPREIIRGVERGRKRGDTRARCKAARGIYLSHHTAMYNAQTKLRQKYSSNSKQVDSEVNTPKSGLMSSMTW